MIEFDVVGQWIDPVGSQFAVYIHDNGKTPLTVTLTKLAESNTQKHYTASRPQTKRIAVAPHWTGRLTAKQKAKLSRGSYPTPFYLLQIIKNNHWNRSTLNKVGGRFERWEEKG